MIDPDKAVLSDGEILLRPVRQADALEVYQAVRESLNELVPWMSWCHPDYSLMEAVAWAEKIEMDWKSGQGYQFVICSAEGGELLGGCGLAHINRYYRLANLGYWVRTSRTRLGIASRAARLLAGFAFESLNLYRAEIVVAAGNQPSQRAAAKSGAAREGILRNRIGVRDTVYDAVMFSLIPEDLGRTTPGRQA